MGTGARSSGLDLLRAVAITLVFMYHYMVFVSGEPTFGALSVVGWVGVDLFFVLSGYLIGNQVLAGLVAGQRLSLRAFFARRALRTWPAFWCVLAAYFLFPGDLGGRTPPPLWKFLTFTQNFMLQPGTAFSHAWSLCIEEQFYLALPLVVLAAVRFGRARWQAWALLGSLLAVGVVSRILLWQLFGREQDGRIAEYYPHVYYATLCRFDEFLPGIAVALLKNLHPTAWQRLQAHGQRLLAGGVVASLLMLFGVWRYYQIDGYGYGFFMSAFGYSLIAMAFALLLMAALMPGSSLYRLHVPGAYRLALWSYSIYLTHKPVAFWVSRQTMALGWAPSATLAVVTVASLGVGVGLFALVEKPFMALRDRWFPSTFEVSTGGRLQRA